MKIAITASEPTLEAAVDPRFGRCPYFLVVDRTVSLLRRSRTPAWRSARGPGFSPHSSWPRGA